jgi:hypothetical protein
MKKLFSFLIVFMKTQTSYLKGISKGIVAEILSG